MIKNKKSIIKDLFVLFASYGMMFSYLLNYIYICKLVSPHPNILQLIFYSLLGVCSGIAVLVITYWLLVYKMPETKIKRLKNDK